MTRTKRKATAMKISIDLLTTKTKLKSRMIVAVKTPTTDDSKDGENFKTVFMQLETELRNS